MTDSERPTIADLEMEVALEDARCDEPEPSDWMDLAVRVPHPALATYDVFCKRCEELGHHTILFHIRILKRPPTPRHTNIEIILVGQRGHRSEPAIVIHGDGRETPVAFPESSSRIDPYSATNMTDEEWPIHPACHRCRHSLPRGLGKRSFHDLLRRDPPLTL